MPLITFTPSEKSVTVKPGTCLLDAVRHAQIPLESPCGGGGGCGKCVVRIIAGKVNAENLSILTEEAVNAGYVLSCCSTVLKSPLTVELPEQERLEGVFSTDYESIQLIDSRLLPAPADFEPLSVKYVLHVPAAKAEDGQSDVDRLMRSIQYRLSGKPVKLNLCVLQTLADTLRAEEGQVTVTVVDKLYLSEIIYIEPGDFSSENYGIAIDVGTTTVAIKLVSLSDARILTTLTDYNDQITCGSDIISRINYAGRPKGLEELRRRILDTINRLITNICEGTPVTPYKICNCVIAGNTTMIHLLLGLKPEYIRIEPYTPTVLQVPTLTAEDVGIGINPYSPVQIVPGVGSYVGGDITSGLLCTDLVTNKGDICLFIDIGTNGELVIGNRDFLMTCACSAGPAFEGGGIECGMRAAPGAIDHIRINSENGLAFYQTIGNVKPKGICGSGMISLLAGLFMTGWIDEAGKFDRSRTSASIHLDRRNAFYTIVPAQKSESGKPIMISEQNIENIMRAKAAIYSACSLLLDQIGINFNDLSRIYIAGGFGRYIDLEKSVFIGLMPDLPREKFKYIGNAALVGAYMALVSKQHRQLQSEVAQRMTYVELNTNPEYMNQYVAAMFLPHTDKHLFPSVQSILKRKQ